MANPIVLEYLKKYNKTYGIEDLKRKIISSGYSEEIVEEALAELGLKKPEERAEETEGVLGAEEPREEKNLMSEMRVFEAEVTKEKKPLFLEILLAVFVILIVNIGVLFYKIGSSGLTGLSITENVSKTYQEISPFSKLLLLAQWIVLILILVFSFMRDKKIKNKKDELQNLDIKKMSENSKTDLDTLYNILKNKKQLKASSIAKLFKIGEETALEWCKILESGNLAVLDYSSGEPVIKIIDA